MPKTAMEMVSYMMQRGCDADNSRWASWRNVPMSRMKDIYRCAKYAGFSSKIELDYATGTVRVDH